MTKLSGIDDLKRVRDEALAALATRQETCATIMVGTGTCGIAAGARETLDAIVAELSRRNIDAHVTTVGCIGMCVSEPLVDIQLAGQGRVTYGNVKPQMVNRLIEEHLVHGHVVDEWTVASLISKA